MHIEIFHFDYFCIVESGDCQQNKLWQIEHNNTGTGTCIYGETDRKLEKLKIYGTFSYNNPLWWKP